jgi:hypothetical protein
VATLQQDYDDEDATMEVEPAQEQDNNNNNNDNPLVALQAILQVNLSSVIFSSKSERV